MPDATLTSKGQITIPAHIRKALRLSAGERVVFTQLDDGTVIMRAKTCFILQAGRRDGLVMPPQAG